MSLERLRVRCEVDRVEPNIANLLAALAVQSTHPELQIDFVSLQLTSTTVSLLHLSFASPIPGNSALRATAQSEARTEKVVKAAGASEVLGHVSAQALKTYQS